MNLHKLLAFVPFRGKTRGPEDDLALEVGSQLRAWALEGRLRATFTCIPHEVGAVSKKSAGFKTAQTRYAKVVASGLIAGSGDYVFVGNGAAFWCELKSSTGSLSEDQRGFRDWCAEIGAPYVVCRSLIAVEAALVQFNMLDARK